MRDVLDLVAAARSNAQIAAALHLSPKTVRDKVSNVLAKLPVTSRTRRPSSAHGRRAWGAERREW